MEQGQRKSDGWTRDGCPFLSCLSYSRSTAQGLTYVRLVRYVRTLGGIYVNQARFCVVVQCTCKQEAEPYLWCGGGCSESLLELRVAGKSQDQ